jgi:hypothetical protein
MRLTDLLAIANQSARLSELNGRICSLDADILAYDRLSTSAAA